MAVSAESVAKCTCRWPISSSSQRRFAPLEEVPSNTAVPCCHGPCLHAVAPAPLYSQSVNVNSNDDGAEAIDRPFVEVSSERSLREIEENDIVVVDGVGPMRPVVLHYESAQCWVDPDTQTSVQVIVPWQEMIFYPVSTY